MIDCGGARVSSLVGAGCVLVLRREDSKGEDMR
jgi:hypothetical protein